MHKMQHLYEVHRSRDNYIIELNNSPKGSTSSYIDLLTLRMPVLLSVGSVITSKTSSEHVKVMLLYIPPSASYTVIRNTSEPEGKCCEITIIMDQGCKWFYQSFIN